MFVCIQQAKLKWYLGDVQCFNIQIDYVYIIIISLIIIKNIFQVLYIKQQL